MISEARIEMFVAMIQDKSDAAVTGSDRPVFSFEMGKRYARIVRSVANGTQRSAYGFIDLTNGDMLKQAGWKGPAKGVRGNIFDASTFDRASFLSIR